MTRKRYIAKTQRLIPVPLLLALGTVGVIAIPRAIAAFRSISLTGLPKITITIEPNNGNDYSQLSGN